jgi:hypothetical protein
VKASAAQTALDATVAQYIQAWSLMIVKTQ